MRLIVLACAALLALPLSALEVSDADALAAGRKLWQNECGGTVSGLTSWNAGENFPSLGIGHFIWYPKGTNGPFEESFPQLVRFLVARGVAVPAWLREAQGCPWPNRAEFQNDLSGPRVTELRNLLASTVAEQARFAAQRLQAALPKMLAAVPAAEQATVQRRFERVAAARGGIYPLLDYVNFKGEGVKESERYAGRGWGLLQVLAAMRDTPNPRADFAAAADAVLTERVKNAPPERNEGRWLAGWKKRVATYAGS
ncbi:MAG: hypothetical protein JSR82_22895 [Verrucomicrobia bacterium]|nr:hypothetical protein [Verrucomicrobiota bacterium]